MNTKFDGCLYGILIEDSSCIGVMGNTIVTAGGIRFSNSSSSRITGNQLSRGFSLLGSSNISVVGNDIWGDSLEGGMWLTNSLNNSVVGNIITNMPHIGFTSSHNNRIIGNHIAILYDIRFYSSSNNSIFHNNFMTHMDPMIAQNSSNVWDDGYPSGGNYWKDYDGMDLYSGPHQNETGSDGIGDTPYLLVPGNLDNYPLEYQRADEFDTAIVNVSPSKTTVPLGDLLPINVTVKNEGLSTVTFNLILRTAYRYDPQVRAFKLQANAAQGWNNSVPGPTITAYSGDTIALTLEAADSLHHRFYVDYSGNAFADPNEPQSQSFINTTTTINFNADTPGNFTYYCAYHQDTMFGSLIVNEVNEEPRQIGSQNVTLAKSEQNTVTFVWNTTGFALGRYDIEAYAQPVFLEIDTADNTLTYLYVLVIPEFSSITILLSAIVLTTIAVIIGKKRPQDEQHH
jgi:plastocyanin